MRIQSETTSLPSQILRRSNRVTLSLRQHLAFPRSRRSQEPPVVEVAAGRKFPVMWIPFPLLPYFLIGALQRLVAANLPEYIKVDDTRHPSSQQMQIAVSQDMKENSSSSESSDIDSLPDVHWCKAFFCYYSCWSHGRLRMPPRWRLKNVDSPHQDGMTSSGRDGARG
ncbi:uncharacterized protein EDB91DRAFT_1190763 [Suillus paluster]|uniref:uncharacterized protein n=1 Tax=Suillus paluster TaxID=48578 RepID=UPI001B868E75|nr:uncharacterized protein EDB91DRAFT_1190763 [Suillus paluster]KAG1717517.1 hypothetical protein EDB91DRAFT_1190763 [Suillus paluster]